MLYAKYNGKDVFQKYGISQDWQSRYTQEQLGEGGYVRPLNEVRERGCDRLDRGPRCDSTVGD